ncbi:MAG: DNA primase [Thermales bacterium]|nr:DNA primase [Thermales bacterium]
MSIWQEIKSKLSVEDIIGEYINIEPAGSNYKCVCPFHNENTPSMMLSPSKQIWHCFGCGAGGDIFKFVEDYDNLTPKEALEKLAKKAGIKLEQKNLSKVKSKEEISDYQKGLSLLQWASDVYNKILLNLLLDRQNPVTKYCLERGLNQEIIQKFLLGYAPKQNLIISLSDKYNLDKYLLFQTGVLAQNRQGGFRDKFIDRLVIPIFNDKDKVIGFTGRVLPWDVSDRPKYLNSPQNHWFNKSEIWFGLNIAKNYIRKSKSAILVEGNMDVVSAHKNGLLNTIASQGTAFTEEQLKILKRHTTAVTIAFDNDIAGRLASQKFFIAATKLGLDIQKYIIPEEFKDLDEYLQNQPDTSTHKRQDYLDYSLYSLQNPLTSSDPRTQKEAINNFLELLINTNNLTKEQYISKISDLTGVTSQTLNLILQEKLPTLTTKISPKSSQLANTRYASNNTKESEYLRNYLSKLVNVLI